MSSTELCWRCFWGHMVPALCFLFASLFLLLWVFTGCRELVLHQAPRSRPTFYQKYLQIPNTKILFRLSLFIVAAAGFGIVYEGIWYNGFVLAPIHPTLYSLYFFPGICGLLESTNYLPPRSTYAALVLAVLGEGMLFLDHANSKSDPIDAKTHAVLAYLAFLCAGCFFFSLQFPERLELLVGGYFGFFLQGSWLAMIGIKQLLHSPFESQMITIDLIFHFLFVGFVIAFASAYLQYLDRRTHGVDSHQHEECRSDYDSVTKQDLDVVEGLL